MKTLKQIGRVLLIIIAVLVIVISLSGIVGSWWANTVLSDVTNRVTTIVNGGVTLAETGVQRADQLVGDGRSEVQNASQTVTSVGQNLQDNSPVLTALNNRVEARLGPTVDQLQTTLEPAVSALKTVDQVLSVLNAIPFIKQDAPRLQKLQDAMSGLTQLAADVQQMRTTLNETVTSGKNQLTSQAVGVITGVATRIDTRLADLQTTLQTAQSEIDDLQVRIGALNARLLLIFDLTALGLTLFLLWVIYSQVVLIRHQWRGLRSGGSGGEAVALPPASAAPVAVESAAAPVEQAEKQESSPTDAPDVATAEDADVAPAIEDAEDVSANSGSS